MIFDLCVVRGSDIDAEHVFLVCQNYYVLVTRTCYSWMEAKVDIVHSSWRSKVLMHFAELVVRILGEIKCADLCLKSGAAVVSRSDLLEALIFPLSKNDINFDETLQPHEYYCPHGLNMATSFSLYCLNHGDQGWGVVSIYRDLVLFPL